MRFKILFAALALGIVINLLADPSIGQSQQPGGFGKQADPTAGGKGKQKGFGGTTDPNADPNAGGGFGKGGKGGGKKNQFGGGADLTADQMFDRFARGKDVIDLSTMGFFMPQDLKLFVEENKITDGKMTKDTFNKYFAARDDLKKKLQDKGIDIFGGKGGKGGKGGGATDPNDPFAKGGKGGKKGPKAYDDQWAEDQFKRYDLNSDSKLTEDEITKVGDPFRTVWKKYDADNNGYITLAEWKQYQKDRAADREANWASKGGGAEKKADPNGKLEIEEEERIIIVWRKDKLPPELPAWFKEVDKYPHDGQITLLEWRKAGKSLEEFQAMDRNDDGILTIEEVLRYTQLARAGYLKRTASEDDEDDDEEGVARPQLLPGYPQAIQRIEVVDPSPKSEFDKKGKGGKKGGKGKGVAGPGG